MKKIFSFFETGEDRYQPDPDFTYTAQNSDYRLDQRALASFVGTVAIGLPLVMLIGVLTGTCLYSSISHFYYAQFLGGVFIAALVFIGTFLLAYRGESARENRLATYAGLGAIFVALFPTSGRGCQEAEFSGRALADFILKKGDVTFEFVKVKPAVEGNTFFELFDYSQLLHGLGATVLFAFLAWYSFYVFTRVIKDEHGHEGKLTPQKRERNVIYRTSGRIIVGSMAAIVIGNVLDRVFELGLWDEYQLTFWFESLALWAFGISWVIKGRVYGYAYLDERDKQNSS